MDIATLATFAVSFFVISASPGLCMTLAMSLGISVGVRRTLWMMLGELIGVTLVGAAALLGLAALLVSAPHVFSVAKVAAAVYLIWAAIRELRSPATSSEDMSARPQTRVQLAMQGFLTAASNPKAWVFFAALLPPFIDPTRALWPQTSLLLGTMVLIEFACLLGYAWGGGLLQQAMTQRGLGQWLHRVSAAFLFGIAGWLLAS